MLNLIFLITGRPSFTLGSPYLPTTPAGPESPNAATAVAHISAVQPLPPTLHAYNSNHNDTPHHSQHPLQPQKHFQLSENSAFNLAATAIAGAAGFPTSAAAFYHRLNSFAGASESTSASSTDYCLPTYGSEQQLQLPIAPTNTDNMDLINPYMRHHSFATSQSSSPSAMAMASMASRSPPNGAAGLHHHLPNAGGLTNGFAEAAAAAAAAHHDYQNLAAAAASRDHLLDYHNAAAAAAYAANNNNLSSPLMLLKAPSKQLHSHEAGGTKSTRSAEDSSTPPPLLSASSGGGAGADHSSIASSSRLQSESPDNCANSLHHRNRYDNNSSPGVDSSKSYPVSQRSGSGGDEAGNNSESSPPPPDYSPENLSANRVKYASALQSHHNNNNNNNNISGMHSLGVHHNNNNNMLEHKLPLSFLGPPLAALHSMTEMKTGGGASGMLNGYANNQQTHLIGDCRAGVVGSGISGSITTTTTTHTQGAANPHGIDTILSKPPPVTSAGLSALTGGELNRRL